MADLITHGCIALLCKRGQQALRPDAPLHLASFVAGNLLPDLLARLPAELFTLAAARGAFVPPLLLHGWGPFHIPAGMVLTSLMLALLFPPAAQRAVFGNLLSGMLLHLAIDLLQSHAGAGYLLLFPLSTRPFELGWIGSEATVVVAPLLVVVTAFAWRDRLVAAWRRLR
ncbi:MAG: hypothetical protein D6798_16680 [Deltaproteobacteria bacterium]|nr:MAG: hypothetical protein D6798_16680 [Deltaproteobacteria bacterium]